VTRERNNRVYKWLDGHLGPPIIAMRAAFDVRQRPCDQRVSNRSPRIALVKTESIGDTLLTEPLIKSIKHAHPVGAITYICMSNNADAVRGLDGIDEIIIFDLGAPLRSLCRLTRLRPFDVVIDCGSWARINSVIATTVPAACRVGFRTASMHRHYAYDIVVDHDSGIHELDNYRNLLRAAGITPQRSAPRYVIGRQAAGTPVFPLPSLGEYVVLHIHPGGAQRHLKCWPDAQWIELGRRLIGAGIRIYISGGRGDAVDAGRMANLIDGVHCASLAGQLSLDQTAQLIAGSRLLVTVDTGIMHLGAAVGANVISLHGPTSPRRWGGIGRSVTPVCTTARCAPCINLGFDSPCRHGGCMDLITVDAVFTQAAEHLKRTGRGRPS